MLRRLSTGKIGGEASGAYHPLSAHNIGINHLDIFVRLGLFSPLPLAEIIPRTMRALTPVKVENLFVPIGFFA